MNEANQKLQEELKNKEQELLIEKDKNTGLEKTNETLKQAYDLQKQEEEERKQLNSQAQKQMEQQQKMKELEKAIFTEENKKVIEEYLLYLSYTICKKQDIDFDSEAELKQFVGSEEMKKCAQNANNSGEFYNSICKLLKAFSNQSKSLQTIIEGREILSEIYYAYSLSNSSPTDVNFIQRMEKSDILLSVDDICKTITQSLYN